MTKRERFEEMVRSMASERFGEGTNVTVTNVLKENGVRLTGLSIKENNSLCAPTCYIDDYYNEDGELEEMAERAVNAVVHAVTSQEGVDSDELSFFRSYEKVKDMICYRVINAGRNEELLKEIPYIRYHDLAICFYVTIQFKRIGRGTILIRNGHMEEWGVDADQLMEDAKRNTEKLCGGMMVPMEDILMENLVGVPIQCEGVSDRESHMRMYVLTNQDRIYGAAVLFYGGWLEKIREKLGNYYIIPSSMHELIIVVPPANEEGDESSLREIVREVNEKEIAPRDYLSDTVYYYDGELRACA